MRQRAAFDLVLDERKVLTRIGFKGPDREVKPVLRTTIGEERRRALTLVRPASLWTVIDYKETNRHPVFAGAIRVALCLCTIGPALEAAVAELMETDVLRGLILDAFGSQAVAEISRQTERNVAARARELGLVPSKRFAPGYRSWPVEEQAFLFSRLPADRIGVRLTDSYMMIPRKSYSFRVNFCAGPAAPAR
jgi:hypothetical protein